MVDLLWFVAAVVVAREDVGVSVVIIAEGVCGCRKVSNDGVVAVPMFRLLVPGIPVPSNVCAPTPT